MVLRCATAFLLLAAAPAWPEDPREQAARLLGQALAGEPPIEVVQRAAAARAAPDREEAGGWRSRARLEALVPRLTLRYRRDESWYRSVGLSSGSETDYVRESPGNAYEVRLDWDLGGLVLGRRELEASAAATRAEERRQEVVLRATRLYHERLKLRVGLLARPPAEGQARAEAEIALALVTAELDALTGLYGEPPP